MSQIFSGFQITLKDIIPSGRGKRAIGTLFLVASLVLVASMIVVSSSRASVTVTTASTTNPIAGYITSIRDVSKSIPITAITLNGTASETMTSIAPTINSVSGVVNAEVSNANGASLMLYSNATACTSASTLASNTSFKLCGLANPSLGSPITVMADADGNPGNGIVPPAIGSGGSTWIVVLQASSSTDTLDNNDQFNVTLGTNAITTSANSPTITAYTSDTYTFTTAGADSTAPTMTSGGPPDNQVGAPPDAVVDRTFSEAVVPSRLNTTNITLKECTGADQTATTSGAAAGTACSSVGSNLCATITPDSTTHMICSTSAPLSAGKWHEFTIGAGVIDTSGNAITPVTARFKMGNFFGGSGGTNTTPPRVNAFSPPSGSSATFPTNVKISATFPADDGGNMKNSMDGDTAGERIDNAANLSLKSIASGVSGSELCGTCTIGWDTTKRILNVTPPVLTANTEYDFCILIGARNKQGMPLPPPPQSCTHFKTGSGTDTTAPTLRTTNPTFPVDTATSVSPFTNDLTVSFGEAIDPSTLSLSTVRLCQDSTAGTAGCEAGDPRLSAGTQLSFRYDTNDKSVHISPLANNTLADSTKYCFDITNGVKDLVGNAIAATSANCFTTGTAAGITDTTSPKLVYTDADNFKLVARFSEGMRAADLLNLTTGAINTSNVALQCGTSSSPTGTNLNLASKTGVYRGDLKELEIRGLGFTPGTQCTLTVTSARDYKGNTMDTSGSPANNATTFNVQDSATTGGLLGAGNIQDFRASTDFGSFALHPSRCQPNTLAAGATTNVDCELDVSQAFPIGSSFILTFPSGFTVSSADKVALASSPSNSDINGPGAAAPTVGTVTKDQGALTVTVPTAVAALAANDHVRFQLSGIVNPSVPATDARISIIMKDNTGLKVGQTITAAPFQIQAGGSGAGSQISGKVCRGSSSGGACGGSDTAIGSIKVICDQSGAIGTGVGFMGHQEATSDATTGVWSMTGLTAGSYNCGVPQQAALLTANVSSGAPFAQVLLSGANKTLDFKFATLNTGGGGNATSTTITITGGAAIANTSVDVFCNAPGSFDGAAPTVKQVDLDGSGNGSSTITLLTGKSYQCGTGPHMSFDAFSSGGPLPIPTFNFMPPAPVQVVPGTNNIAFTLSVSNRTISGTVIDGSSTGIPNMYVHAFPVSCFDASNNPKPCSGGFAQTKSDGTYTLNVTDGTYNVGADGPGLPRSTEQTVVVNGSNQTGVSLKILKSSTTISGQILDESGNGIKFAGVSAEKIGSSDTCASFNPTGGHADTVTDSSGNWTLYTAAGTWCIRAYSPTYGQVGTKLVTVSSTSLTSQNIQATATDYGTISGTVTKNSAVTAGAFINCYSPTAGGGNGATSASDGTYSMKVKAGSGYSCDGYLPGTGPLPRSSSNTVAASGTTTVNFTVAGNAATINVTIAGITDAGCDARDSSGVGSGTGQASSAGVYSINVPAGTYTVRCGGPKYGPITVTPSSVTVTAGGTTAVTGTAPTTRTVSGRVTDAAGTPANIPGVTLQFAEKSTGKSFTVQTGSQSGSSNNLSATNIPEGSYNVTATKSGYAPATTTATVSGGNLTMSSTIALTQATGSSGVSVSIPVQASSAAYAGEAKVIATNSSTGVTVVAATDATTGNAALPLTNGTWTVAAVGDNGKQTASTSTVVVASGAVTQVNGVTTSTPPTLSLATSITGFTAANDSENISPSAGGLMKFEALAVGGVSPEVNIAPGVLSSTDSSTGKVDMKNDPTLAAIDPGADSNFVGSSGYQITPKDSNGNEIKDLASGSVTITVPYTDADVAAAGVAESKMQFASYNTTTQAWETFPTTVDTVNNLLTATVTHFSSFGIIGSVSAASTSSGSSDTTPPAVPTNVQLTSNGSSVTVTWTDPADADFSNVQILRNDAGTTEVTGEVRAQVAKGDQRYVDTTVVAGRTYKYILKSRDTSSNQRLTAEFSVAVAAAATGTTSGGGSSGSSSGTTTTNPPTSSNTTITVTNPPAGNTTTTTTVVTPPPANTTTTMEETPPPAVVKTVKQAYADYVVALKAAKKQLQMAQTDYNMAAKYARTDYLAAKKAHTPTKQAYADYLVALKAAKKQLQTAQGDYNMAAKHVRADYNVVLKAHAKASVKTRR